MSSKAGAIQTGVRQFPRTEKNGGTVRIFVGDTQKKTEEKMRLEGDFAKIMANATGSSAWEDDTRDYKTLALEHKLAAKRGGFFTAYEAMNLLDPDAASPKPNGERSGPSMVRPLLGAISDLATCVQPDLSLNEFAAMEVFRREGVLTKLPAEEKERRVTLEKIHEAAMKFATTTATENATVREVLAPVLAADFFDADRRLVEAYQDKSAPPAEPANKSKEPDEDRRKRAWHALFSTPWKEIARYRAYLNDEVELATHQVVKGSEFKHVMVVMDDTDAAGFLFSYDKVVGGEELSDGDRKNIEQGKETTIDRTLRLLYVTCSRAEESLALVLWTKNPEAAVAALRETGWFAEGEVSQHY